MKRPGFLYEEIGSTDNLRLAFIKARRGKRLRAEVRRFSDDLDSNLREIRRSLLKGPDSPALGNYRYFTVFDPKQRLICAPAFPERVLHHAIINVVGPYLDRYQIADSYACMKRN